MGSVTEQQHDHSSFREPRPGTPTGVYPSNTPGGASLKAAYSGRASTRFLGARRAALTEYAGQERISWDLGK